jgi:diaminopimelate epimerase
MKPLSKFESSRPRASGRWYKAHGLGNDYLVVEEGSAWTVSPAGVERVCDRTRGVGSDGVVVLLDPAAGPPFRLRMFNPDGGEFERSGNGLRILASHLHRTGRVPTGTPFEVEVGGDRVRMEVHGTTPEGIYDVSVEMGRASVDPADVGLAAGALDEGGRLEVPALGWVALRTVSVGNPHAVVFIDGAGAAGTNVRGGASDAGRDASSDAGTGALDLTNDSLHRVGPGLATHDAFAHGTNVQLARPVPGEPAVEALIWERGVGPTSASGTSACAVAVAAVHTGRVAPGEVEVRMEGGTLRVTVTASLEVVLRGPVQEVSTGELTEGFLTWLGA